MPVNPSYSFFPYLNTIHNPTSSLFVSLFRNVMPVHTMAPYIFRMGIGGDDVEVKQTLRTQAGAPQSLNRY